MIKQTGVEGLSRRRHSGVFQTVLLLSLSKFGCLVFNFQDGTLKTVGSLCLLFGESSGLSMRAFPRVPAQAAAPGAAHGGAVPPLHGCSVCGKGFQETIDQMKPP